ncbi:MAG: monomeric [FeFe] hydrogenase [Elusimicrobiota bacterium]|jgi:[FeFe] hydrogenase (group B1/B3)|nr:monomeric [FeFe] hydrogenase [Elusimicrobiota bacterium]
MKDKNDASITKKELLVQIIRKFMQESLKNEINRIPFEIRPKHNAHSRCCVYKDRAVLKYRIMAMLGISVENESDESKQLSEYLDDAVKRDSIEENILTVLDIACSSCATSRYLITNACQGCFARPCIFICPNKAITLTNGKADIDYSKCINCGACTKVCPYHAIIRLPIPCEEACPVDAIKRDEKTNVQHIDFDKCIYCGKCIHACPFSAILEKSQLIDTLKLIKEGKKVVAMIAPSIVGQFPFSPEKIAGGILELGFYKVEEVAFGADLTTENETKEFIERMEKGEKLMTSSCCPAYVEIVKKHVPDLLKAVSSTPSPMKFIAKTIKAENPELVTVFIGPCVAKKIEAIEDKNTDYVLTFEELDAMFTAMGIELENVKEIAFTRKVKGSGRGYATSCGVSSAILKEMKENSAQEMKHNFPKIDSKFVNGIDKRTVKLLQLYSDGKLPCNFLEIMACEGGCVGGPCVIEKVKTAIEIVKKEAERD